jgi:phage-related baseplate assembly protein
MESDDAFLERIQDAYEGLSVAGPRGAYIFHARSADGRVMDAQAHSPEPCDVVVSILSYEGDGTASEDLLNVVRVALNDEEIRPLGDRVTVQSSTIVDYQVTALLHMTSYGPGNDQALAQAIANVTDFVNRRKRQGWSVWRDKLSSLMHVEGVDHVELTTPAADIEIDETQAARCTAVDIQLAPAPQDPDA